MLTYIISILNNTAIWIGYLTGGLYYGSIDINYQKEQSKTSWIDVRFMHMFQTKKKKTFQFKPGDWRCILCTDHQFAKNTVCRVCGSTKITLMSQEVNQSTMSNSSITLNLFSNVFILSFICSLVTPGST